MAFNGHLPGATFQKISLIAAEGDVLGIDRSLRMKGISTLVTGSIPLDPVPIQQFGVELAKLDRIERLPTGEVPVVTYLRNVAFQLKLRGLADKAEPFERAANAIGNRENGVPPMQDPATLPEVVRNEVIVGLDDMVDFSFLAAGQAVGHSVARILVPRFEDGVAVKLPNGTPWTMSGTAWLVGNDLVLTNHHVVNARKAGEAAATVADFELQAGKSVVQFDYDNATQPPVEVKVVGVVTTSMMVDLDYALLRLETKVDRPTLRLARQALALDDARRPALNIIQHPRGETKRVALRNNLVTFADQATVRYFTDTDYGSSGSPVCDDYWRVVALHRGALPADDVMYLGKKQAYVNFGSQITAILDHIGASAAAAKAEILAAQKP